MDHDPETDPEIVLGPARKVQILYTTIKDRVVIQLDNTNIDTGVHPNIDSAAKHHREAAGAFANTSSGSAFAERVYF